MNISAKSLFSKPNFLEKPYGWVQHTPFAFHLIESLKPEIFVELGAHTGNSYFSFCQAVDELKLSTICYAVDTWEGDEHASFYGKEVFERVKSINSRYFPHLSYLLKMKFDDALQYFSDGSVDLLHIDGCHIYEAVKHDYETWLPKVSNKGVVVIHDTNVREKGFGVWKLFEEIRGQYPSFEFLHGHGLGVICVGKDVEPEFLKFVENAQKDSFVHHFFATLGNRILAIQEREDIRAEVQTLNSSIKLTNKEVEKKEKETAAIKEKLNKKEKSIIDLESKLKEHKAAIDKKNKSLSEWESKIKKFQEETTKSKSKNDELEKKIADYESRIKKLNKTVSLFEKKIKEHKNSTDQKNQEIVIYEARLQENQDQIVKHNEEISAFEAKLKELQGEINKKNESIHALDKQYKDQQTELKKQRESISEKDQLISTFENKVNEHLDTIKQNEAEINSLEVELKKLQDDNIQKSKYLQRHELQQKDQQTEISKKNEALAENIEFITSLKTKIDEHKAIITKNNKEIESLETHLEDINAGLYKKNEKIVLLEFQVKEFKKSTSKYERKITNLENKLDNLKDDLSKRNEEILLQKFEIKEYGDAITNKNEIISNLEQAGNELNKNIEFKDENISSLKEKQEELNRVIAEKAVSIVSLNDAKAELNKAINQKDNKIEDLVIKLENQIKASDQYKKQLIEKEEYLRIITNSISWRITKPLRYFGHSLLALRKTMGFILRGFWFGITFRFGKLKEEFRLYKYSKVIKRAGMFDENFYLESYPDIKRTKVDPITHYVKYGAAEGRNPSPEFDTKAYLEYHEDVALEGLNPLVHYILFGKAEGRQASFNNCDESDKINKTQELEEVKIPEISKHIIPTKKSPTVDIIVCIHNALDDVKNCLNSIIYRTSYPYRLILVNDGSNQQTTTFLKQFSQKSTQTFLINNKNNKGYTKAANIGLKAAEADYNILLNSDTIVTYNWIERIIECGESDPKIGIIGPLSNAASYQSVPKLYDDKGDWSANPMQNGISPDHIAEAINNISKKTFPKVPYVNGFCYVIKKEVINKIGYLDEEKFPVGYGEENDYSIRAKKSGFDLTIADNAYVFHQKSKSFSNKRRKLLAVEGRKMLDLKHGKNAVINSIGNMKNIPAIDNIRKELGRQLANVEIINVIPDRKPKILWLMRGAGGGGGALSIVQEANCIRSLGFTSKVAVNETFKSKLLKNYKHIPDDVFVFFKNEKELVDICNNFDIIVGTLFLTIKTVENICKTNKDIIPAYYIQDYEPWIVNPEDKLYKKLAAEAFLSYTKIKKIICFAKTNWIKNTVEKYHPDVFVHKISPGFDTNVFKPDCKLIKVGNNKPIVITAMIRPETSRRSPVLTLEVLREVKKLHGDDVEINVFGCEKNAHLLESQPKDFLFNSHGKLTAPQVSDLFAYSDVFLDASIYQAFGRTGLEAMARGCAVILPSNGGAHEYGDHNYNCLFVNTKDLDELKAALEKLIKNADLIEFLANNGVITALRYSVVAAAISQRNVFVSAYNRKFFKRIHI